MTLTTEVDKEEEWSLENISLAMDGDIIMHFHRKGNEGWYCYIDSVSILSGEEAIDARGFGDTPENSLADLARNISGKVLVWGWPTVDVRFQAPENVRPDVTWYGMDYRKAAI